MAIWDAVRDTFVYRPLAFAESAESLALVHEALALQGGETIVGITSSGDMLLSLLATAPERVLGVDTNPAQTALARLKHLLIARLEPQEYKAFAGLAHGDASGRREIFRDLAPELGDDAPILERHGIDHGILDGGATVWIARAVLLGLRLCLDRHDVGALLDPTGSVSQRLAIHARLAASPVYRFLCRPVLALGARAFQHFFYPPALCAVSDHPRRALQDIVATHEPLFAAGFADNPAMGRLLTGRIPTEHERLLYAPRAWQAMRRHLPAASFQTAPLTEAIASMGDGEVDAFYLSNCPDYLRGPQLAQLADVIGVAARPGARVVYFSLDPRCPFQHASITTPWRADPERAARLMAGDPVGLYPLMAVGQVH